MNNNANINIINEFKGLFLDKKYDESLTFLQKNRDVFDISVYEYNLGIVYHLKNENVQARIHLEKAQSFGYISNDLDNALREVKAALQVTALEENVSQSDKVDTIIYNLPIELFYSISLLLGIIFILKFKNLKNIFIKIIFISFILLPPFFYYTAIENKETYIAKEDHNVFRGPSKMFEHTQLVPKGMKIYTERNDVEGWKYIVHPDSHQGWIIDNELEKL